MQAPSGEGPNLQRLETANLTVIPEVKKDKSIFTEIIVDTKNKITSFDMIGWTDPSQPNP